MWDDLSTLPLRIDAYELERLSLTQTHGWQRVTSLVRLQGDGHEGLGEDVSPYKDESNTLHEIGPVLPLAGDWTLGTFCAHLHELDQWPIPPRVGADEAVAQLGIRVRGARSRAQPGRQAAERGCRS